MSKGLRGADSPKSSEYLTPAQYRPLYTPHTPQNIVFEAFGQKVINTEQFRKNPLSEALSKVYDYRVIGPLGLYL